MTPGESRAHARFLRDMAAEKRRMAADPHAMPHWRRFWLNDADRLDDTADWHDQRAGRGEIAVEYQITKHMMEAAQ